MNLSVNDHDVEVPEHTTVADLLRTLGYPQQGIAVAVDTVILPRSRWSTPVTAGAHIDVLTAVQGG